MENKISSTRTQKIIIKKGSNKKGSPTDKDKEMANNNHNTYGNYFKQIDDLSLKCRNLYNTANFIVRKEFFKTSKEKEQGLCKNVHIINCNELDKMCRELEPYNGAELNDYKSIGCTAIAQHTLKILSSNWKSYIKAIKDYGKHPEKYTGQPKIPGYIKGNRRIVVEISSIRVRNKDGYVFFGINYLKNLNHTFKLKRPDERIFSLRFVPLGGKKSGIEEYSLEVIQEVDVPNVDGLSCERIAGIDLGINNLATIVTNCGVDPIAINGKPLKAMNAFYNKKMAEIVSELKIKNCRQTSKRLTRFIQKRNHKMDDYMHKASTKIVEWLLKNQIDTVVCGHNTGWKQNVDMGKVNNQNFTCIPHNMLIDKIKYKCEDNGIRFIETEEGYTSGTSFLDDEEPIAEYYDKSRRVYRGLFISNENIPINADVNGAYQIIKKMFPEAFDNCIEYGRHPQIININ